MKTNKSYTKRLKVTRTGKVVSRTTGQNHFNAKVGGEQALKKKREMDFAMSNKAKSRFLPGQ